METAVLIIGNSWDGSVLPGDLVLERDQLFACILSFSLEGKLLQEGQPPHCATCCSWCPTSASEVGKGSSCQQPFQATALSLALLSCPAMHTRMKQNGLPHADQRPLLSQPPTGHSWSETHYSMAKGQKQKMALPIRRFLMHFAVRKVDRNNAQRTPLARQKLWRSQGHKSHQIAFRGYSCEHGPVEPGQSLTQRAMTKGLAKIVCPPLPLTSKMIQTCGCP